MTLEIIKNIISRLRYTCILVRKKKEVKLNNKQIFENDIPVISSDSSVSEFELKLFRLKSSKMKIFITGF